MAFKYQIIVDDKGSAKIKNFGGQINKTAKKTNQLTNSVKALAGAYLGMKGLSMAIKGAKDLVNAYAVQERAETRLKKAMQERGVFTLKAFEAQKKFAAALQQTSVFGDENILNVQRLLTNYGLFGNALEEVTKAAADLASAKGMDLAAAADLIGRSVVSSTNAMSRYGIEIEGVAGSAERLDSAIAAVNEKFGGSAQADIETYAGKIQQLENRFGDLKERIGKKVVPIFQFWAEQAGVLLDKLEGRSSASLDDLNGQLKALEEQRKVLQKIAAIETDPKARGNAQFRLKMLDSRESILRKQIQEERWGGINIDKSEETGGIVPTGIKVLEEKESDRFKDFESRMAKKQNLLMNEMNLELEIIDILADAEEKEHQRKKDRLAAEKQLRMDAVQGMIGNALALTSMFAENNEQMFSLNKGLAIAQATMNTYEGATKAIAQGGVFGPALAATTVALGLAQVATIASTQYKGKARGGVVEGPGSGTSDSIPTMLSKGEKVLTAEETTGMSMGQIRDRLRGGGSGVVVNVGTMIGTDRWVQDNLMPSIKKYGARK